MRRRFARFKLRAHLLDLCGLFFHHCHEIFELPLLLGVVRFQFLNFAMLFEKLIEQHRVDLLIANGFRLAFWVATHQVRIHFGHFLCDQAKGNRLSSIVLLMVAKGNWVKRINGLARRMHWLNVMFVSARRDIRRDQVCRRCLS